MLSNIEPITLTLKNDNIKNDNLEILEKEINQVLSRTKPCHLIFDFTKVHLSMNLLRKSGNLQKCFQRDIAKTSEIIKSSDILVKSRPAKYIVGIFLKIVKPTVPTKIKIHKS